MNPFIVGSQFPWRAVYPEVSVYLDVLFYLGRARLPGKKMLTMRSRGQLRVGAIACPVQFTPELLGADRTVLPTSYRDTKVSASELPTLDKLRIGRAANIK